MTMDVTVTEAIAYDCGFRAGQAHAAGPLKALEAIVAQSRVGDGSKPVTFSGRVNYPAPLLFAARAAIAAAKGAGR
jgi:hypothetical protein